MQIEKRQKTPEQKSGLKGERLTTPFIRELCVKHGGDPDNYISPYIGLSTKEIVRINMKTIMEATNES